MIEVMKPKRLNKQKVDVFDGSYVVEPKLDGYRCVADILPGGEVHLWSRIGTSWDGRAPHIEEELARMFPPNTTVDGEIFFPEERDPYLGYVRANFKKTSMIMGSQPKEAQRKQDEMGKVVLILFDLTVYDGKIARDLPFKSRRDILVTRLRGSHVDFNHVSPATQEQVDIIMQAGAEGVVFKNLNSKYYPGERPSGVWYKLKKTGSIDAIFTGTLPPDRYNDKGEETWLHKKGLIGAITFAQYKDGKLRGRGSASGMDEDTRRFITDNELSLIGSVVEIQHMGLTDVALRHPQFLRFRDDKPPEECIWDE